MTRVFVAKDGDNKSHGWVDASLGMVVVNRSTDKLSEQLFDYSVMYSDWVLHPRSAQSN